MESGRDDGLGDALRSLPRERPPEVTLEAILDRWQRRRRAALLGGGFAVAAALLAFLLVPAPQREIPVHLRIRVIEAPQEAEPVDGTEAFSVARAPEELQAP
jgi:hypothetical protein